jgi:hypothetical protein
MGTGMSGGLMAGRVGRGISFGRRRCGSLLKRDGDVSWRGDLDHVVLRGMW